MRHACLIWLGVPAHPLLPPDEVHELVKEMHLLKPSEVGCNAHLRLQLGTHTIQESLASHYEGLMLVLQEEASQPAAQVVRKPLVAHHQIEVMHPLSEDVTLGSQVMDNGCDLTNDISPSQPSREDYYTADGSLQHVRRPDVSVAHGG